MTDSSAVPATTDLTLTPDEMATLSTWDDGSYNCPCRYRCVCDNADKIHLFDAVASIVSTRVADAQTDAWDEGATYADRRWQFSEYNRDGVDLPFWETPELSDNPYRSGGSDTEQQQKQINRSEGEEHAGSNKVVGTHTPHTTPNPSENP